VSGKIVFFYLPKVENHCFRTESKLKVNFCSETHFWDFDIEQKLCWNLLNEAVSSKHLGKFGKLLNLTSGVPLRLATS